MNEGNGERMSNFKCTEREWSAVGGILGGWAWPEEGVVPAREGRILT